MTDVKIDFFSEKLKEIGFERRFKGIKCDVIIGAWTYYQPTCQFRGYDTGDKIIIGKFCSIAQNVTFVVGGNHNFGGTTYPVRLFLRNELDQDVMKHQGDVVIGNDVWIGYGAMIVRARIGDGCIIGAGAVVRGDIPPYSIVIGNPAQVIGYRFSEKLIGSYQKIQWWDWPIEKIKQEAILLSTDPEEFASKHGSELH